MKNIIDDIRKELIKSADEKTKEGAKRFFKEQIKCYGVKSAIVGQIAKKYFAEIKDQKKEKIFHLAEELFKSDYEEEAWIAASWVDKVKSQFQPEDIKIFEKWIFKYINDWAKCDTFCNHAVGAFIEKYPEHLSTLKKWAHFPNQWLRRASAVSLIIPAKHGKFIQDIFEISDILLLDKEDLVQKGYGWMLKAASQAHQYEVFEYVMRNKKIMPRTALRYAIEKMPEGLRKKAMEK